MTDAVDGLRLAERAALKSSEADWAGAAALWQDAVRLNPVRGDAWDRLAEARFEGGDYRGARTAWARALDLGVWDGRLVPTVFAGEVAYRVACCHAELGEAEQAIEALGRALRLRFRELDRPRTEKRWAALREDERVRSMLGIIGAGLSRDEGWRCDVRFLAREICRRSAAPGAAAAAPGISALAEDLARAVPVLSDAQIIARMLRLLRPLGDGHAYVAPPGDDTALNQVVPVKFVAFAEGLFITAAVPEHRRLLGARVLRIGERPAAEVLAALEPLISRDNDQQVAWLGPEVLCWTPMLHALGLTADPHALTLDVHLPDDSTATVTVPAGPAPVPRPYPTIAPTAAPDRPCPEGWISLPDTLPGPLPRHLRRVHDRYWFEYVTPQRFVYFQFNGVGDAPGEPLAAFTDRLFAFIGEHDVRFLVLDLRWNGGGNTLLIQPLLHQLIPTGSRPNFTGETCEFRLPWSGTVANVSDLYWQTSWPIDSRPWIAPELYVPPRFADYSQNQDAALAAILEFTGAPRAPRPGRRAR